MNSVILHGEDVRVDGFSLVCAFLIVAAVDYRPVMAAASLLVILLL